MSFQVQEEPVESLSMGMDGRVDLFKGGTAESWEWGLGLSGFCIWLKTGCGCMWKCLRRFCADAKVGLIGLDRVKSGKAYQFAWS